MLLAPLKPKGGSNGSLAPYKSGCWCSYASLGQGRWSTPIRCWRARLSRFNAQVAVAPTQEGRTFFASRICVSWQQTIPAVSLAQRLQLLPDAQRRSYARARVQVHEHFDGYLSVHLAGRCVATTEAPLETSTMRTRSGPRGGPDVSMASQTPSSAVVLLNTASTAELGKSGTCQADQSAVPGKPAASHPWRKPWVKSQRTESLDT